LRSVCSSAAAALLVVALAGCAGLIELPATPSPTPETKSHVVSKEDATFAAPEVGSAPNRRPSPPFTSIVYGQSFDGRPLVAYRLGEGPIARALIGGLHGGYEWNTTTLVSKMLDHLIASPELIPAQLTLYIIPLANPDGAAAGTDREHGRMNGNGVDLNRNWDYEWQMTATHALLPVYAGAHAFSEPETAALRDFVKRRNVSAAIFYHSQGAEVYSGAGHDSSRTVELAQLIAERTGYRYAPEGIPGEITTGDAIDWLTSQGITAVEVELSTHADIDWEANLRGLIAFLRWDLSNVETAE
jgi:hypothetical protein